MKHLFTSWLFLCKVVLGILLFVASTEVAYTQTWDGGGGDNNWTTAANWVGDVAPVAGNNLTFNATGVGVRPAPNNNFAAGTNFGTITIAVGGYTIGGNSVNLTGGLTVSNAAGTSTVSLIVGGAVGVTKTGAGTLTLSGANTYSGATTISTGTLALGTSSTLSTAGPLGTTAAGTTVVDGAALDLNGFSLSAAATEALSLDGTGIGNLGALTNSSATPSEYIGVITFESNGTSIVGNAGTIAITGTPVSSNADIIIGGTAGGSISTVIAGARKLDKEGTGTWVLSGANTFTEWFWLKNGTVSVSTLSDVGLPSPVGAQTFASGDSPIYLGTTGTTGRLLYTGTGHTVDKGIAMDTGNGGGIVDQSGTGLLEFSGIVACENGTNATYTLTLQGSTSGTGELSGIIQNGTEVLAIAKSGTGTWTLSGANTYTGGTTLNAGTLLINGNHTNASGTVSLNGGTLGGIGRTGGVAGGLVGSITSTALGGTISPGSPITGPGTLTSGNVDLSVGAPSFVVQLNGTVAGTGHDQLNVTGTVNLTGATLSGTVGFASVIGNTFTIINNDLADAVTGTFAGLAQGATVVLNGINFTISYTGGTGNDVVLTRQLTTFTWDGEGVNNNWTTAVNWVGDGAPGAGDNLVFDATGVGARPLPNNDLTAATSFGTITVSVGGYTIGGNSLALTTGLTGSNPTGTSTVSLIVGGAGTVTKSGAGTLILSGANTYTGLTTVSAGVLNIRNATALGTTAAGTSVTSGAALQIQNTITVGAEALTLNGNGIAADGALRNISGTNTWQGTVTLGSAARINSDAGTLTLSAANSITAINQNLTLGGAAGGTVGGTIATGSGTLTKDGAGTWTLSGANTYTGLTTVSAGVLNIRNATALGTTAAGTSVTSSAALQIQNNITVGAEALTLNGTGIAADGALRNVSGNNVWQGTVTLASAARINSDVGSLTFNTAIPSITAVNQDLTLGGAAGGTVSGTITTGSGTLTKDGAGTWTLSGANTYTGLTTVIVGVLNIRNATALGTTAAGTSVTAGAALQIQGTITVGAEALTLNGTGIAGDGALRNVANNNIWQGTVTLGSAARINSDAGTLTFNTAIPSITAVNQDLTFGGAANISVGGTIDIGSGAVTKDGAGAFTHTPPSDVDNWSGPTTIIAGTFTLGNPGSDRYLSTTWVVNSGATLAYGTGSNVIINSANMTVNTGGTLNLGGRQETIGTLNGGGNIINMNTVSAPAALSLSLDATSNDFSGVIAGTSTSGFRLGPASDPAGIQILSGINTYTGPTGVFAGTLLVNGSTLSTGTVNLSGGTLGGTGSVGAITSSASGGTISPGSPITGPGILSSGNVDLSAAGTRSFVVQINGAAAGTGYDQLNVTGTVNLDGATFIGSVTFPTIASADVFTIINNDGADAVVGTFAGLAQGALVTLSGIDFIISYTGGTGNDVVLTANTPLPIELLYFKATLEGEGVVLKWATATELNNDFFTIERASDIEKFEEVAIVKGQGTNSTKTDYSAIDDGPLPGRSYYRLKQTDFDGKFSYSELKKIEYSDIKTRLRIYPNPVVDSKINIELTGMEPGMEVPLRILNMQGVSVFEARYKADQGGRIKRSVELPSINGGIYIVIINTSTGLRKKIVIP